MKKILLLCLLALPCGHLLLASHLRCGYIIAERSNCTSRTVKIKIVVFTNTASDVKFGEDGILYFGDGTSIVVPRVENTPRPDLGANIGMASYTVNHLYGSLDSYLISYVEPNRNGGVLNMEDSFWTTFYTETRINLAIGTCSSPVFLSPPVFFSALQGSEFKISLGTASHDDNLITYEMAVPYRDRGLPVVGYTQPGGMSVNNLTGVLTWNIENQTQAGEYTFAVIAKQWAKVDDQYRLIGFSRIDFQVILNSNASEIPMLDDNQELDEYSRILVQPTEEKKIKVFYEVDSDRNPILEMFSELDNESVSFTTYDSVAPTGDIKVGVLTITPQEADVRENAYLITVRGRLNGGPSSPASVSDINYVIYTDEIPEFPFIVDPVTATEREIAEIEVFPNPVQEQVNIEVNRPGESEALLYTAQGVFVKTKTFELTTSLILTDLPSGVYICEIRRNNIIVKRIKIIKD